MSYRIKMDISVSSELDAIEVLNAIEFVKKMARKEFDNKCICDKCDENTEVTYGSVDFTGPRKMHNLGVSP